MALYIIATPIGNLKDITLRALEVLKSVDIIAAEDTRVSRKLLAHYDIHVPLVSYHEHSRDRDRMKIIDMLSRGKNIAYIVDAGTPSIADPGSFLVQEVHRLLPTIQIVPIPGASALAAAISIAGIQGDKFTFMGFPPHKKGRRTFFEQVVASRLPVILYESPHRILKTLKELSSMGLSRFECVLIKEISKVYERILRNTIENIFLELQKEKSIRGEFVLVINKNP